MLRLPPGVVVQKKMSMQGMADLYRIRPDLLECLVNSTIEPLLDSLIPPTIHWILIYLPSCGTKIVLSFITAIQFSNIFLFAVIFCLYWMEVMHLALTRRFFDLI